MKKLFRILIINLLSLIKPKNIEKILLLVERILTVGGINLLEVVHRNRGILKYETFEVSGESFFVTKVLPHILADRTNLTMFDVGANTGAYSRLLQTTFPNAMVYAFEPNPFSFQQLITRLSSPATNLFNIGFGKTQTLTTLYTNSAAAHTEHASLFADVFTHLHRQDNTMAITVKIDTVDSFCDKITLHK